MTQQQRLNALLELVSERGNVTVDEVCAALDVSAATARRDLNRLAEQRLISRTHGGAAALGSGYELPLQYKIARRAEAKRAIARAALELVGVGDAVGVNGGTTTSEVARELGRSDRFERSDGEIGLTIVTNALNIGYELSVRPHIKIVLTGGVARRQSYELIGPLVDATVDQVTLDTAFIGIDGLTAAAGATTLHEGEAAVSRRFAAAARRVVAVADASKLGVATFARILPLASFDTLITDAPPPAPLAGALADAGVGVVVAAPAP